VILIGSIMSEQVKVLKKGKITIPADVRRKLGIKEGDTIALEMVGGRLVLHPLNVVLNPTQTLSGLATGVSFGASVKDEMARAVSERVKRKTGGKRR